MIVTSLSLRKKWIRLTCGFAPYRVFGSRGRGNIPLTIIFGVAGRYGADRGICRFCCGAGKAHGYRVSGLGIVKWPIRAFGTPR